MLGALERFGYNTEELSPVIVVMLFRKLDQATLVVWENDKEPTVRPALQDVRAFLIKRASTQGDSHARIDFDARQERGSSRPNHYYVEPSHDHSRDLNGNFKRSRNPIQANI